MNCPNCQCDLPDDAKFCGSCGKSLKLELVCPQCGRANSQEFKFCLQCGQPLTQGPYPHPPSPIPTPKTHPTSFANNRYQVKKFLGEGGKKKVYLTQDTLLDRDVAFALIKTEKLDQASHQRIRREAQAMGKLGDHPNIVGIFDMGEENGQPYVVLPLMPGGDVEGLIEKAPERRLPIEQAISITKSVCKGLEYAHVKGIIHRDLKPGNVWLTADGTARIGDFGLALAVELSRLTQEGMMVGTYYYMPPEQAMGGEVTTRADLYSLGAMLYEMVTGRPPFTGDDTVAIIGQHINTPPVSPSWHRPDLPPPLAALIMRLLEKDPSKRPASASEVLKALEAIETGKAEKVSSQEAESLGENPVYRRVFVGREPELRQLQSAFDAAASGQGSLTMVIGEPGIGKTALTEQLATYAALRGGQAFVGHCYEEGSLSLPYLAFIEAMRSYAANRDVTE
ncbi:MAG: protein kinase, partial [Thermodesulfobacteriota bacterium]